MHPLTDSIHNEKRICCELFKLRREQVCTILLDDYQLNSRIVSFFIGNISNRILSICENYQTKGEKLCESKAIKPNQVNQTSKTLIRCANSFIKLYGYKRNKLIVLKQRRKREVEKNGKEDSTNWKSKD